MYSFVCHLTALILVFVFLTGIHAGTLDAIVKMIRYEGLTGFYKGMGTKIVQSVFAASVLFMIKEELVKAYDKSKKLLIRARNF